MQQNIYLSKLQHHLKSYLSGNEIERIIEQYQLYFDEEIALGKGERQIINDLGPAKQLADIICHIDNVGPYFAGDDLDVVLAEPALYDGTAIYEGELAFNHLKIDVINASVNLIFHNEDTVKLYLSGEALPNNKDYSVSFNAGKLHFIEHHGHARLIYARRRFKNYTLNCYIPAGWNNFDLALRAINGKLTMKGLNNQLKGKLNIASINGGLQLNNISANELNFNTVNGSLNANATLFKSINIKSVNNHSFINYASSAMGARLNCKAVNCGVSVNGRNLMQGHINGISHLVLFNGSSGGFNQLNLFTVNGSLTITH
jgi:hypothetical protein